MALTSPNTDLILSTQAVHDNEPCFEAGETNKVLPKAGAGLRRIQRFVVIRDDRKWEFVRDLGPAATFKADQVVIGGYVPLGTGHYEVLETVGRMRGMLEDWRAMGVKGEPRQEPIDFRKAFEEFATRRRDAKRGRKRFAVQGRKI